MEGIFYYASREISKTHPGWTDLLSNIPTLPQKELVYIIKKDESEFKVFRYPGKWKTVWTKDIFQKFTKPSNLLIIACAGLL